VRLLKHDVTEMLLTYGADVNIMDHGRTIAHTAAELNDTLLMLLILRRHKVDFSIRNEEGETPLMVAIALSNREAIKLMWDFRPNILSSNEETILHYAARHNNIRIARNACDPDLQIDLNQQSQHELRTALHIAVQQSNVAVTCVLLEHGALDKWEDRYGRRASEYITDNAIMLFFRYNIPCNIENVDVTSRTSTPINVEENMEGPQQNEAQQESNNKSQVPSGQGHLLVSTYKQRTQLSSHHTKNETLPHPNVESLLLSLYQKDNRTTQRWLRSYEQAHSGVFLLKKKYLFVHFYLITKFGTKFK
jgi:ankyrin repeat protein